MQTKPYVFLCCLLFIPFLLQGQFLAADINKSAVGSNPAFVRAASNYLVFTASNDQFGRELFINKGPVSRPQLVKDLNPGTGSSEFWDITLIDSTCYFVTSTGAQTLEFWRFSMNNLNPVLLRSLPANGISGGQNGRFIKLGDQVYFIYRNVSSRMELWKTDGTPGGTDRVFEFGQNVLPNKFEVYNNQLIFLAEDNTGRSQIWKSDGTTNGTSVVKSVDTEFGIFEFIVFKNLLYFVANDGTSGRELWQSDGTAEGTKLFADLAPGNAGINPSNLKVAGNTLSFSRQPFSFGSYLYFSSDDGVHGQELWRSDGTDQGTIMLPDLNKGSASSEPEFFTPYRKDLYFSADDGIHGRELWRLLSDNVVSTSETEIAEMLIFPNPATDKLTIRKTEENKNLQIRLHDAQGRTVINSTLLRDASTDFNVSHLSTGLYLLEIVEEGTARKYTKKIVVVR